MPFCFSSVIPYRAQVFRINLLKEPVVFYLSCFFRFSSHNFFTRTKVCVSPWDKNLRNICIKLKYSI